MKPCSTKFTFRTERKVPKLGVMLVGWGGNNGTTVTAAVLANQLGLHWMTKTGKKVSIATLDLAELLFQDFKSNLKG